MTETTITDEIQDRDETPTAMIVGINVGISAVIANTARKSLIIETPVLISGPEIIVVKIPAEISARTESVTTDNVITAKTGISAAIENHTEIEATAAIGISIETETTATEIEQEISARIGTMGTVKTGTGETQAGNGIVISAGIGIREGIAAIVTTRGTGAQKEEPKTDRPPLDQINIETEAALHPEELSAIIAKNPVILQQNV